MFLSRVSATLLFVYLVAAPVLGQRPSRIYGDPQGGRFPAAQDNQIVMKRRAYDTLLARGNQRAAAVAASQLALAYEQRSDYTNAATWYQTAYKQGDTRSLSYFLNLVISKKVSLDNPDSIRPLVEVRAFCGSQMARAFALEHYHETPAQLPDYYGQTTNACVPAAPDDHMDQSLMIKSRQRHVAEASAAYYKLHPDQDPEFKRQQAMEGAALLLGALVVHAASMPASGPGSIACNKYKNGYPGATDASVCNVPPSN